MKRLVEFPLQEGGTLLVEVDEPEGYAETTTRGGVVKAARPGEISDKARDTFEDALDKIRPAAQAIIDKSARTARRARRNRRGVRHQTECRGRSLYCLGWRRG